MPAVRVFKALQIEIVLDCCRSWSPMSEGALFPDRIREDIACIRTHMNQYEDILFRTLQSEYLTLLCPT